MMAFLKLMKSFKYAIDGLFFCIKSCRNFRIHTIAAITVIYISSFYDFSASEKALIYLTIGAVLSLECINTAIEQICDNITLEYSMHIKHVKDVAAGAVLCSAIGAVAVFLHLFYDIDVFKKIFYNFGNPIRLAILLIFIVLAVVYIFYEDIFKYGKK